LEYTFDIGKEGIVRRDLSDYGHDSRMRASRSVGWLRIAADAHKLKILSEDEPFTLTTKAGVLCKNTWENVHHDFHAFASSWTAI